MKQGTSGGWRAFAWQAIFGVLAGLLAAGGLWLAASPPRGEPVRLLPPPTPPALTIHVSGAVVQPGVYTLPPGSRVTDAIRAAGGLLPEADSQALNLAAPLEDGLRLHAPRQGEAPVSISPESRSSNPALPGQQRININTASKEQLESLPGIGPVMAQAILDHRQAHGPFASAEAIQDVDGIGPVTYQAIRDLITVGDY